MLIFICQDVEPEECVVICHQGKEVELELEDDQSLLFSTLKSHNNTRIVVYYDSLTPKLPNFTKYNVSRRSEK